MQGLAGGRSGTQHFFGGGCEPRPGKPPFWKEAGGCHCLPLLPVWPPNTSNTWGHQNWVAQEMPLVPVASDIWDPNYNLRLPSHLQLSVYATMISLTPFGVLVDCDGHIHLTDGETDQKRQGECSRSQRVPTWTQAPLIPSPIHLHRTSSFQTALCGVLGCLGSPEARTEEEVEKEAAHFTLGHTYIRILCKAGLKHLCC